MIQFLTSFEQWQLEGLRQHSSQTGSSIAELIRQGVNHILSGRIVCEVVTSGMTIVSGSVLTAIGR